MVAIINKFGPPTFFIKFMTTSINTCRYTLKVVLDS